MTVLDSKAESLKGKLLTKEKEGTVRDPGGAGVIQGRLQSAAGVPGACASLKGLKRTFADVCNCHPSAVPCVPPGRARMLDHAGKHGRRHCFMTKPSSLLHFPGFLAPLHVRNLVAVRR